MVNISPPAHLKLTPRYYLGVDPGLTGAIAVYDAAINQAACVHDMPRSSGGINAGDMDLSALSAIIAGYAASAQLALIEKVHSMPHDGHVGAFTFGYSAGAAAGVIVAHNIPIKLTPPSVWKSLMGLSRDKQESIDMARRLFPQMNHLLTRKKDDGRAEALLLAYFAATKLQL